jgi:predicted metalloprotease with PDZ domain
MIKSTTLAVLLLGPVTPATAQIRYDVMFPNAVHHEAEISVTYSDLPRGPLELRMSRSSPGRYAIHEFAKNVYDVRVDDGGGRPLGVERPDPYQWNVPEHAGTVRVRYTLYADRADGTYSQIDETHAHMNMPATFMWARGLDDRPVEIAFHPPEGSGWQAATQLFPTDDPMRFTAPNRQYFLDSPTELSDFALRTWDVEGHGERYTIRLAVHHRGTDAQVDQYAEMVRQVVAEEIAVFGSPADYDVGTYTFIADYLPYASGDGMEHRNSTILSSTGSLANAALGLLGTVSHEFFHSWNVERIRPRSLEPFDFEHANMSRELWFAEGFTSYYTPLFITRAGLRSVSDYAGGLSGGLDFVINSPGRTFFSPVEMSMRAPFVDAATAIDPVNHTNIFISYYTWGSVIGLALDLTLRGQFDRTLDDYMQTVWERHGVTEQSYTVDDLERILGEFTGDAGFASDFFSRYIRGREAADYETLLSQAGFLLRPRNPGVSFFGIVQLEFEGDGAVIESNTRIGEPLYQAGLDRGDTILSLGGHPLRSDADWQAIKDAHHPGDVIAVEYVGRGGRSAGEVRVVEDPRLQVVTYEEAGLAVTPHMRAFRVAWLGSRAGN